MRLPIVLSAAVVAVLLVDAPVWAQPYRIVGSDGRVTYSDTPPAAADARGNSNSGGSNAAGLPYDLAQTAQKYPVTLYTSQSCAPCNSGRDLLINRGIPFTEKTVDSNDDITALKKITGNTNLPLLTIGDQQISSFQDSNWSQYLSAAGYPETSQLPGNYHRPAASPLAPPKPEAAAPASATTPTSPAPAENIPVSPPRDPSNPAGIEF